MESIEYKKTDENIAVLRSIRKNLDPLIGYKGAGQVFDDEALVAYGLSAFSMLLEDMATGEKWAATREKFEGTPNQSFVPPNASMRSC